MLGNDNKINPNDGASLREIRERSSGLKEMEGTEPESLSEASKISLKPLSESQQYNLPLSHNTAPNGSNFITLGKISGQEKIEIIQTGFQFNQEGKISFKKYYESTDQDSLFQWKKHNVKYETIRRIKLYSKLKDK